MPFKIKYIDYLMSVATTVMRDEASISSAYFLKRTVKERSSGLAQRFQSDGHWDGDAQRVDVALLVGTEHGRHREQPQPVVVRAPLPAHHLDHHHHQNTIIRSHS